MKFYVQKLTPVERWGRIVNDWIDASGPHNTHRDAEAAQASLSLQEPGSEFKIISRPA